MRRSQQQQNEDPHTLCTRCKNFIRTANFLIHEARCKGSNGNLQQSQVTSRILESSSRMRGSRSPIFSYQSPNKQEQQQRIPCHFCSYPQTLAELDTHPKICPHREEQCSKCKAMFPKSLMEQHKFVCLANRYQQAEESYGNYEESEEQEMHYIRRPERMMRNRPPGDIFGIMDLMMNSLARQSQQNQNPARRMIIQIGGRDGFFHLIQMLAGGREQMEEGLSKEDIKNFPVSKFKKDMKKQGDSEQMCIICYCNFEEGEDCMTLPCKHLFHPECIGTWLQKNPTCPVCKRNLGQNHEQVRPRNRSMRRRMQPGQTQPPNIIFRRRQP